MHMFQPADIVTPINLNPAGEDLSAQALDAHAAGIVAPDATIDGDQIDILKIHRTKTILHAEDVIIISRCPGGAGCDMILADGDITHDRTAGHGA